MNTALNFGFKCMLICSLTACNSFFRFSNSLPDSQKVTENTWSAKIIENGEQHKLQDLTLNFSPSGKVVAKCHTCDVKGYWYEDEHSDKFIMSFEPNEELCELNKAWDVQVSGSSEIVLRNNDGATPTTITLKIP